MLASKAGASFSHTLSCSISADQREQGVARSRLVQWCHGAPGFVPLLLKLRSRGAELSGPGAVRALEAAADRAADVIWERGLLTKVHRGSLAALHLAGCITWQPA